MGPLVTNNGELTRIARVLKDNGRLAKRVQKTFRFSGLPGMNLKTTEFSAATACAQVEKRFEIYERRKQLYHLLMGNLKPLRRRGAC